MKSIKAKIIAGIIICTLLSSASIGFLSIKDICQTSDQGAEKEMTLTCLNGQSEINAQIAQIAQSVDTLSSIAMERLDFSKFKGNNTYVTQYTESLMSDVVKFGENTNGAICVYVRYNPDFTAPTSGIFLTRNSTEEPFTSSTPTDFTMYEKTDLEHVGWYYIPVQNGAPIWMEPYLNGNVNIYMISYVVPLYADGESVGIIGMDIDCLLYTSSNIGVVENTVNPLLAEAFAYQETESVAPLQVFIGIAGSVWLSGMVVLLIFALVSMIKLRLRVREAVRYKENIYICDAVKSPFILGIIKPRIYLSSALSEEEMDYIIAHERAHLKRKDHLWKPFGYLLLCIYWFNPLCWIAYIMLCKDIELACDEKVIKDMSFGDKKEYSRVLLFCATQRHLVMACPLAFGEVGVKERVKTVLNYKKPTFWITIAAIVVCAIVAICFLTNPAKEYQIRITIPAGSETGFYYSDEEICPKRNTLTIAKGGHLGDMEVILWPVEVKEENAYDEPIYITAVAPAKMDVEKGAWFKIGVNMQNPTAEDIDVYVIVRGVEVRIASKTKGDNDSNGESAEEQNSVTPQNLEGPQEPDANEDAVYEELNRVVSTIGLELSLIHI